MAIDLSLVVLALIVTAAFTVEAATGFGSIVIALAVGVSLSPAGRAVSLASAGVVHGVFASGGPLLVYVLGRSTLDKGAFRSTLAAVWLILDLVLIATYASSGRLRAGTVLSAAVLIPSLLVAAVAGEWAHARLDQRRFKLGVFAVLMAVGISIALEGVRMP